MQLFLVKIGNSVSAFFLHMVNDEGAEAAAVTVVQIDKRCEDEGSPPPPPNPFRN